MRKTLKSYTNTSDKHLVKNEKTEGTNFSRVGYRKKKLKSMLK